MAIHAGIRISMNINPRNFTDLQRNLIAKMKRDKANQAMNEAILETANEFVPRISGSLAESGKATAKSIMWKAPYARYQYGGIVYAPNSPITRGDTIVGWYTRAGTTKHPTNRELGVPGKWRGWNFGYTTENTSHHWVAKMMQYRYRIMQIRITSALKKAIKE